MQNDLIPTTEAAVILGVSIATVNRWAAAETHPLKPRHELPGETGARLFSRRDVERLAAKRAKAAAKAS